MPSIRVASWNANLGVGGGGRAGKVLLLETLAAEGLDLVFLQEVAPKALVGLTGKGTFAHAFIPTRFGEQPKASAILVSERLRPLGRARTLSSRSLHSPHKTIWVRLEHEDGFELTAASFHVPPGSQYGPEEKRATFRALARWMAGRSERTLVGVDANSPVTDAYCDEHGPECLCQTRYFPGRLLGEARGRRFDDPLRDVSRARWRYDQEEYLLHDPVSAPTAALRHNLRDAYRSFIANDSRAARQARSHFRKTDREQPHEGCLVQSHLNRGKKRRFDFIYATSDLRPDPVEYRLARGPLVEGEHALVIGTLRPRRLDRRVSCDSASRVLTCHREGCRSNSSSPRTSAARSLAP